MSQEGPWSPGGPWASVGLDPWQRLDGRMIAVDVTRLSVSLVPLLIAVAMRNADAAAAASTLTTLAIIGAVGSLLDLWRWSTTWYRVTDDRIEVRTGVLSRRHRSMPRDRVRRVDASAKVLHRLFGLAVVTIASGEQAGTRGDELRLDAVAASRVRELRHELLGLRPSLAPEAGPGPLPSPAPSDQPPPAGEAGTSGPTIPALPPIERPPGGAGPAGAGPAPPVGLGRPPASARGGLPEPIGRAGTGPARRSGTGPGEDDGSDETVLASLRWGWAPYAVLSLWTLAAPALALGAATQALSSIGVTVDEVVYDDRVVGRARDLNPAAAVALATAVVVLVGVAGSLLRFVETWWGYRLVREAGGRLRIHRGLLTSRSISLDEARLRGAETVEPLPLRTVGAVRLHAVTTGVEGGSARGERADVLLPAAPAAEARELAAVVLGEDRSPLETGGLRGHPPAARRRRLVRAAAATTATAAVLAAASRAAEVPPALWLAVPVVALAGSAWARDAYRSLGHAIDGRFLTVRRGAVVRRTVALQRSGIIGWTVRCTALQRRAGVVTVVATTAAGSGAYALVDVDASDGLLVADEAVPGVLRPFLVDG